MAREGRIVARGLPHHVVHRGHNRQDVFLEHADYDFYLSNVRTLKRLLGCKVYAYCLMSNHVHLIVEPVAAADSLAKLMQRVAGRQTLHFNAARGRRGTLWEGRFKSSPVDTDRYLAACCRYVEHNPVRAGVVERPERYPWSSFRARCGLETADWLDDPPADYSRASALLEVGPTLAEFREAMRSGRPTGDRTFHDRLERLTGRALPERPPGRPREGSQARVCENRN